MACNCGSTHKNKIALENRMKTSVQGMVRVTCPDCIQPLFGTRKEMYPVHQTAVYVKRGLANAWKQQGHPVIIDAN